MEAVKSEVLNLTAGSILVLTVDTSNLPASRAREMIDYVEDTYAAEARANGNLVMVTPERVRVEVLTFTPADRVVCYVDIGDMPSTKAKEFLNQVREYLAMIVPPDQCVVVAKGSTVEIQSPPASTGVTFSCEVDLGINNNVYATREIAEAHIRHALKVRDLHYTLENLSDRGIIQFSNIDTQIITTMPKEE